MNEYKYHYLFTSFDLETYDLEDFKYNFVNITSFRLVDIGDVGVKQILKDLGTYSHHMFQKPFMNPHVRKSISLEVGFTIYYFVTELSTKTINNF